LPPATLIARRREGKSVIYSIADDHVLTLVENAVAHASEKH
jgi:DNA-binding transcriptional ArsR family regulator